MSNKGLLDTLINAKTIIPVDSIVSIKNASDGKRYTVTKVIIESNAVNYLLTMNETGVHTTTLHEDKVVLVKSSKNIETIKFLDSNEKDALPSTSVSDDVEYIKYMIDGINDTINDISRGNRTGISSKVRKGVDRDSIDKTTIPLVICYRVTANSYVYDEFIPAGDMYAFIYYPDGMTEMLSRRVVRKPFYKRLFNTLLYGRDNINNFNILETVFDFNKRYNEYIRDLYSNRYDAIRITGEHILS